MTPVARGYLIAVLVVACISGVLIYGINYFSGMPWTWAIAAHASVVAFYAVVVLIGIGGNEFETAVVTIMLTIMASIALPAYLDYRVRSAVAEAANFGFAVSKALERTPQAKTIEQLGLAPAPAAVAAVALESQRAFNVTLAVPDVAGKKLAFRAVESKQAPRWSCGSNEVKRAFLPAWCRDDVKQ